MLYRKDAEDFAKKAEESEIKDSVKSFHEIVKDLFEPEYNEAIAFSKWLKHLDNGTTHYNPHTGETSESIGISPFDCFSDDLLTIQELYDKFKMFEIKSAYKVSDWDLTFYFIDTVPNVKKAYDVLSRHNEWRKGADIEQTNARDLSVAIDVALACMKDVIHLSEENFSDDDLEIK
jgi:hypothetical protein